MDKNTQVIMFSSKTGEWATPQDFFDKLNWRFGPYTLDPCASPANTKCSNFFTEAEDGLTKSWEGFNSFINPPYGRGIELWIKKAYDESRHEDTRVTMLVPARTDTKYWHSYIMKADEVYFVKGRLKFGDSKNSAPFPSAVVVFDGTNRQQIFGTINK
jgi:phage N-6-adenine-methyltransferase|tara:strand:+ start:110 stop:583 length:474 start_codon:yes stop_codon:yes gene_type:complete